MMTTQTEAHASPKDAALKLALEALETLNSGDTYKTHNAATALRQAINATELRVVAEQHKQAQKQEPVAWLITDRNINSIQIESIRRLIDRARHAHMADLKLRINGEDEWYEVDWLKHLIRAIPPQRPAAEGEDTRKWVGLTDEQIQLIANRFHANTNTGHSFYAIARAIEAAHGIMSLQDGKVEE